MKLRPTLTSVALALGCLVAPALGETEPANPMDGVTVTETEIKLPGVTIDRETREVRIDAVTCLDTGLLEYVVCEPNSFEHEAIFTTNTKPELVHAALLLTGLRPTPQMRGLNALWYEKAMKQPASRIRIEVEWKKDGKLKRVPLSSMLRSRENIPGGGEEPDAKKNAKVQDAWVFAGSFLQTHPETGERFYAANASGILVGIWPDPSTVIQYGLPSGNPYDGEDLGMAIDEKQVPKLDTKVQLVFSRFTPLKANPLKGKK